MLTRRLFSLPVLLVMAFATLPEASLGVDGVIEINQARALAGGVSSTDTPGFPVSLGDGGAYRLTGNLQPTTAANVIEIDAVGVILDLNGFSIRGTAFCSATLTVPNATSCTAGGTAATGIAGTAIGSVEIHDGSIFSTDGPLIGLPNSQNVKIRNVSGGASAGGTACIEVGVSAEIIDTRVGFCNGGGIVAGDVSTIAGGRSGVTNGVGITAGISSIIRDTHVSLHALDGISCLATCIIDRNSVNTNGDDGIEAGSAALTGNVSGTNLGYGANITGGTHGTNVFQSNTTGQVNGTSVSRGDNACNGVAC